MTRREIRDLFIDIIRAEVCGAEFCVEKEIFTPEVIAALYSISKAQDLAHIVASRLGRMGLISNDEISVKFQKQEMLSLHRCEQIEYELYKICDIFEKNGIVHVPLKGSVIRPYYPKKSMRTSGDIDILVREEELKRAADLLVGIGYKKDQRSYHDISMYAPSGVHLELHFSIFENFERIDAVLADVWNYTVPFEGSTYKCKLRDEFFVFQIYAHLAEHFKTGTTGFRPILDLWIIEHRMAIPFDIAGRLLEKGKIYDFALQMHDLSEICFSGGEHTEFSDQLLDYIMFGGVSGDMAERKKKKQGTVAYAFGRWLLPYKVMTEFYPVLRRVKILLPFYYIVRLMRLLSPEKRRDAVNELKTARKVTDDGMQGIEMINAKLGL